MNLLTNTAFLTVTFGLLICYAGFGMAIMWGALFEDWIICIDFNHYGEGLLEFVLFGLIAPIVVVTFVFRYTKTLLKIRS